MVSSHDFFGPKCAISSLVTVGDRCVLELAVGIAPLVRLGNDVHVSPSVVVTQPLLDGERL